jgi:hypothetical protein
LDVLSNVGLCIYRTLLPNVAQAYYHDKLRILIVWMAVKEMQSVEARIPLQNMHVT